MAACLNGYRSKKYLRKVLTMHYDQFQHVISSYNKCMQNETISQEDLHRNQIRHFHLSPRNHLDFFSNQIYRTMKHSWNSYYYSYLLHQKNSYQ